VGTFSSSGGVLLGGDDSPPKLKRLRDKNVKKKGGFFVLFLRGGRNPFLRGGGGGGGGGWGGGGVLSVWGVSVQVSVSGGGGGVPPKNLPQGGGGLEPFASWLVVVAGWAPARVGGGNGHPCGGKPKKSKSPLLPYKPHPPLPCLGGRGVGGFCFCSGRAA